jgi:hypothetical protein
LLEIAMNSDKQVRFSVNFNIDVVQVVMWVIVVALVLWTRPDTTTRAVGVELPPSAGVNFDEFSRLR